MFSASRIRAPQYVVHRRLLHSTSQLKAESDNPAEEVQKKVQLEVPENAEEEDLEGWKAFTHKERGFKRYLVRPSKYNRFALRRKSLDDHKARRHRNPNLNAFITEPIDEASIPARAGLGTQLLHPNTILLPLNQRMLAVKDNISSLNFPTTCASQMLDGYKSPYNATVVENLESVGAIVIGKTNMDEFGMGSHSINSKYGAVKPRTQRKLVGQFSAGGSSGGSAVAVATRQCDLALGTDTGGSVRLPAAYTGVIGFKPSYGRFSRWGLVPYANSLDTVGILCHPGVEHPRTPRVLKGPSLRFMGSLAEEAIDPDPTSLSEKSRSRLQEIEKAHRNHVRNTQGVVETKVGNKTQWSRRLSVPIRFGVPAEYNTYELSPSIRLAWQRLLENLQAQGHKIVPISLPTTEHALSAYYVIAAAEAASNLAKYDGVRYGYRSGTSDGEGGVLYAKTRGEGFGEEVQRRILLGSYTLSSKAIDNHFLQAQKIRRLVQRDFDRVFALPNGLRQTEPIDLSELDENIPLEDKTGPAQVDLIICPTAPTFAPSIDKIKNESFAQAYINDVYTVPASLAGLPAISIPVPCEDTTRPAGMQIIGQYYDDNFVVEIAERILCALSKKDFSSLKPPMKNR